MERQDGLYEERALYVFDTCTLITLFNTYPPDLFQPLHKQVEPLLKSGKVAIIDQVLDEIKPKDPNLYNYLKNTIPKSKQYGFEDYIEETQRLVLKYYDGHGQNHKLGADPHLIACAKIERITVVSEEMGSDSTKIPHICHSEHVHCVNFIGFLREEKVRL